MLPPPCRTYSYVRLCDQEVSVTCDAEHRDDVGIKQPNRELQIFLRRILGRPTSPWTQCLNHYY